MPDFMDDILNTADAANACFAAGVAAAGDDARLCSRKLRVALKALQVIAMSAGGAANLESALEKAMRLAAQTALDRIAGLR